MKFAIFSDIHSNLEALLSVFLDIINNNEVIDMFLIPGDIVGYGPNPNECCTIVNFLKNGTASLKNEIQSIVHDIDIDTPDKKSITDCIFSMGKKAYVVVGNHDKAVIGQPSYTSEMVSSALKAARWSTTVLTKANTRFLNSLKYRKRLKPHGIEMVHSTPVYPQGYEYTKNAATLSYETLFAGVTFAGHTHKPAAYLYTKQKRDVSASIFIPTDQFDNRLMMIERETMVRLEEFEIKLKSDQRYYINPGSVGQPRDGVPKASYMVYDTVSGKVSLKRSSYNTEATKAKMLKVKLPTDLANRVVKGN
ncbi:MAG: metallophosphoesterase family protein [Planctomycetes bacterium]|nr:metallophosphoesterase family protein [Planctomycetota bacterium]